jgi:hypothetical protein
MVSETSSLLCVFNTVVPAPLPSGRIRCNVSPSPTDVYPTENSWMLHPLDKVSPGYFAPDRTIPSPNFDFLIFLIIILGGLCGCDAGLMCPRPMCPQLKVLGQGHSIQGTLCSRGATSKNFRSGTHRSGTHQPCILYPMILLVWLVLSHMIRPGICYLLSMDTSHIPRPLRVISEVPYASLHCLFPGCPLRPLRH